MKTSAASRSPDRYIRCDDFADRIDGIELAPEIWAVFAQLAQPRNADELARHLKIDIDAVNAALRRLVRRKLIRKHVLAWRDYAATAAPFPVSPVIAVIPTDAPASAPVPAPDIAKARPSPVRPASPIISLRMANDTLVRSAPVVRFRIGRPAAENQAVVPPARTSGGMKLRPILDAIGAKAGGGVAGQLLVYRVFLQIPTELMQAAGLHSLSLVDDNYTLSHPGLRAALADTARLHAGIDIESLAAA
jgi:hypothetical protein